MKIAVASDHRGYTMKTKVLSLLAEQDQEVLDYGPDSTDSVDYPIYGARVARDVSSGEIDCGVLICGTGIGMCIVANKFPGVRAADCHDELGARLSRAHNDANILCLSADLLGDQVLDRIIKIWLGTEFEGGRHARRLKLIADFERQILGQESTSDSPL